jgi:hypothetical protein
LSIIETDGQPDQSFEDQLVYDNPLSGEDFVGLDDAECFTKTGVDGTGL